MLPCKVCEHIFIDEEDGYNSYDICPVCGFEDDGSQYLHPDSAGANWITYNEAREAFKQGGGEAVKSLEKAAREERYGKSAIAG